MRRNTHTGASFGNLPILENPFGLLGISPRDGRHLIVEAAEAASLTMDGKTCSQARTDLLNPRNRLTAEIAWLPGLSPRRAGQLVEVVAKTPRDIFGAMSIPPLAHANLMASAFLVDGTTRTTEDWCSDIMTFADIVDDLSADQILADINEDRKVAGFVEVRSTGLIEEALVERRIEYRKLLRAALDTLPARTIASIVTSVAEESTLNGTWHPTTLVDEMVSAYAIDTHTFLSKEAENVDLLVARATEAAPSGSEALRPIVEVLEKIVRNWLVVARPIQLISRAKGTTHDMSREIGFKVRNLGIDLYNQHAMLEHSQRLVRLLQGEFADVPEIAERANEDAKALENLAVKEAFRKKTKAFDDLCAAALAAAEKNPNSALSAATDLLQQGEALISQLKSEGIPNSEVTSLSDTLALCASNCVVAYGNANNKWAPCIPIFKAVLRICQSDETRQRIQSNLEVAQKNDRLFGALETIGAAPTLRTVNGFGFAIYGNTDYDKASGSYMTTYYFTALFIPIFPICRYRVIDASNGGYRFLGKGPLRPFDRWHLAASCIGILSAFFFIR